MKTPILWIGNFFVIGLTLTNLYADDKSPLTTPPPTTTLDQRKTLQLNFESAQSSEILALKHRQEVELKELDATLLARREHEKHQQQSKRDTFFKQVQAVDARRRYLSEEKEFEKTFFMQVSKERGDKIQEHQKRLMELQSKQAAIKKQFLEALKRGEVPKEALWPQGH